MRNAAKKTKSDAPPPSQRGERSERRVRASAATTPGTPDRTPDVTGEFDRRGIALAMADALRDILQDEQHTAA